MRARVVTSWRGRDLVRTRATIVAIASARADNTATMKSPWIAAVALAVSACATGATTGDDDPSPDARIDATRIDGAIDAPEIDAADIDAPTPIDAAPIDAATPTDATPVDGPTPIDATPIDAPGCTPTTTQLLVNPAFDLTPVGTGWAETRIDPAAALVTDETPGIAAHTTPYRLWLGGILGGILSDANDAIEQTITVPAGTTTLVLRGQYGVLTAETGTTVYDDARVELLSTGGTVLETIQSLDNRNPTTTWVPLTYTFTNPRAGQSVRLRFRSSNDFSNASSFFWDTLALEATVACP